MLCVRVFARRTGALLAKHKAGRLAEREVVETLGAVADLHTDCAYESARKM